MIVDSSLYFKRIGKNKYIYQPLPLSKYGYLVTYKEKIQLQSLIHTCAEQVIKATPICCSIKKSKKDILFTFVSITVFQLYLFCFYKYNFKKIMGDQKKIFCGRQSIFEIHKKRSKNMDWSEIRKYLYGMVVILLVTSFSINDAIIKKTFYSIGFAIFFSIFTILGSFTTYLFVFYKRKEDKNI